MRFAMGAAVRGVCMDHQVRPRIEGMTPRRVLLRACFSHLVL